jgi:hypothetical protein
VIATLRRRGQSLQSIAAATSVAVWVDQRVGALVEVLVLELEGADVA